MQHRITVSRNMSRERAVRGNNRIERAGACMMRRKGGDCRGRRREKIGCGISGDELQKFGTADPVGRADSLPGRTTVCSILGIVGAATALFPE